MAEAVLAHRLRFDRPHFDRLRFAGTCALCALLCACAGGASLPLPSSGAGPAPSAGERFRTPRMQPGGDGAGILGADGRSLRARFGTPRIDAFEGDSRKLQFSGETCVLDIYLYPLREGGPRIASHVAARLREGGAEVPSETCAAEIERQR